jgi:hypothetical protein
LNRVYSHPLLEKQVEDTQGPARHQQTAHPAATHALPADPVSSRPKDGESTHIPPAGCPRGAAAVPPPHSALGDRLKITWSVARRSLQHPCETPHSGIGLLHLKMKESGPRVFLSVRPPSCTKVTPAILRSRLLPEASSEIAAVSPGQCDSGRCRRENILPHRTHRPPPRKTAGGKWGGVVLVPCQKMPTSVMTYPVRQCITRGGVSQCHFGRLVLFRCNSLHRWYSTTLVFSLLSDL